MNGRDGARPDKPPSLNVDFGVRRPGAYVDGMSTCTGRGNRPAASDGGEPAGCRSGTGGREERDRHLASLMQSAQDGDAASYAQLLANVAPVLRRTVRRRYSFLPTQDVEDIVQDILLSMHTARATYDPKRPFLPWLMAIARNRTADALRRRIRRSTNEVAVERDDETFLGADSNSAADAFRVPEALRQAISGLPRGQRQAIEMLKLREMSLKEAAAATGMSVGALKVAVHRAMRSLHAALSHEI